jgi:hypothetical protein
MIECRLSSIERLKGKYQVLPKVEVMSEIADIKSLMFPGDRRVSKISEINIIGKDKLEVTAWLQSLELQEREVKIYWVANQEAIQMSFEDLVSNYDELWYPAADDVWVIDREKPWILELHHEEIFSFYELSNG